jgi:hypothetical protein
MNRRNKTAVLYKPPDCPRPVDAKTSRVRARAQGMEIQDRKPVLRYDETIED